MENVIDAQDRFPRQRDRCAAGPAVETISSKLKAMGRVPLDDRPTLATRLGELAVRLSPSSPIEGAKRIFTQASFGEKWAKRKRLIRLPGEQESAAADYGAYEASGPTWATLASAAVKLLNPDAEGRVLERERERVLRNMALGTSLLPRDYVLPADAIHTSELIGELANAIGRRILNETQIQNLWDILKAAPFALERVYPETEISPAEIELAGPVVLAHWGNEALGFFSSNLQHATDWPFPIVRVGVLRKRLQGRLYIPPPHIRDAVRDPFDWTLDQDGPNQVRISEWLESEGVSDQEFDPDLGFGWVTMPIETTRSVYLQACPRGDSGIGLWLKVNEPFTDNFIPCVEGIDLVRAAYDRRPPSTWWYEPFELAEDDDTEFGILAWPTWCEGLIADPSLWRDGIIGVKDDTSSLYFEDFAGQDRSRRELMDPPDLIGLRERRQPLEADHWDYTPDGIGGWIDDADNHELMAALFANPRGMHFQPLIAQDDANDVPCRPGTIAEALLRNVGCGLDDRLSGMMINQAHAFVQAGTQFHQMRVERYRAKINELLD